MQIKLAGQLTFTFKLFIKCQTELIIIHITEDAILKASFNSKSTY